MEWEDMADGRGAALPGSAAAATTASAPPRPIQMRQLSTVSTAAVSSSSNAQRGLRIKFLSLATSGKPQATGLALTVGLYRNGELLTPLMRSKTVPCASRVLWDELFLLTPSKDLEPTDVLAVAVIGVSTDPAIAAAEEPHGLYWVNTVVGKEDGQLRKGGHLLGMWIYGENSRFVPNVMGGLAVNQDERSPVLTVDFLEPPPPKRDRAASATVRVTSFGVQPESVLELDEQEGATEIDLDDVVLTPQQSLALPELDAVANMPPGRQMSVEAMSLIERDLNLAADKIYSTDGLDAGFDLRKHLTNVHKVMVATGWKRPEIDLAFENLSVYVDVPVDDEISTVSNTIRRMFTFSKPKKRKMILEGVTGHCECGKTLLVLGPPGSGCSTLLQTLAGSPIKGSEQKGRILYNGSEDVSAFRSKIRYLSVEDDHLPSLTVEQTIRFACDITTPMEAPHREKLVESATRIIMQILGIYHVRHTVVGNNMLRGVSGGEKKRVSIGELLAARGPMVFLDGYSTGLDASAALDIAKALSIAARAFNSTIIATQYQVSQEIFEVYDNVLLLQGGRSIYFGSTKEALPYFEKLGYFCPTRRTAPDFLTSLGMVGLGAQLDDQSTSCFAVVCHEPLDIFLSPGGGSTGLTFEPGTTFLGLSEEIKDNARWIRSRRGWVIAQSQGMNANLISVPRDAIFVSGKGAARAFCGVYEVQAVQTAGHSTFTRRNLQEMAEKRHIWYSPQRSEWVISARLCEEPIIASSSAGDVSHPIDANGTWALVDTPQEPLELTMTLAIDDRDVPRDKLHEAFEKSEEHSTVTNFIRNYQPRQNIFGSAEAEEAFKRPFGLSWKEQVKRLLSREKDLTFTDLFALRSRVMRFLIMGILLGLTFLQLDYLSNGGMISRAGVIYFSIIFAGTSAFSFMPIFFERRLVFYKHRDAFFYQPSAYYLSVAIFDVPIMLFETFLFCVVLYWMTDLNTSENGMHFFCYYVVICAAAFALGNYIRMISCVTPNMGVAQAAGSGMVVLWLLFAGFVLPRDAIPNYFIWIHYLSPLKYALEALLINEFDGTTYVNPDGSPLKGENYIGQIFNIDYSNPNLYKWLTLVILVAFGFLFIFIASMGLKYITFGSIGSQVRYKRKKEVSERRARAILRRMTRESAARVSANGSKNGSDAVLNIEQQRSATAIVPAYFSWNNVSYEVDLPREDKQPQQRKKLLNNVNGYVKPGMMVALMGSSGAGKTTLLDVLARRKTGGYISGSIKVNGAEQDDLFNRVAGYVEQSNILTLKATVREALFFSARSRLPPETSEEERRQIVYKVATDLGLVDIFDAILGSPDSGIGLSFEALKRVTMGVELVAKPSILFMDEPTSGLDSGAARTVARLSRAIADEGRSVICTIHQPSAEIFETFDYLLLLQRGGITVYFGPLGERSKTLINYFSRHSSPPAVNTNPADYILEVIGAGIGHAAKADWPSIWNESTESVKLKQLLASPAFIPSGVTPMQYPNKVPNDFMTQYRLLLYRLMRVYWRDPSYNLTRIFFQMFVSLLLGLAYRDLGNSQTDLRNRVSSIFFTSVLVIVSALGSVQPMMTDRVVFYRERASGCYNTTAYFLATYTVEIPYLIIVSLIFCLIFYWLVGLQTSGFGVFLLFYAGILFFAVAFGQGVAVISPSPLVAQMIIPALFSLFSLFAGFLITRGEIPKYLIWLYYLNPVSYYLEGIVANELAGQQFTCQPTDAICYTSGDAYLEFYDMTNDNKWRNIGLLAMFVGVFRIITYLGLRYRVTMTR